MGKLYALLSLALLVALSGCVSSAKYNLLQSQLDETIKENEALSKKVENLKEGYDAGITSKEERARAMEDMVNELKEELDAKTVKIDLLEGSLRLEVVEKMLFDSGSVVIKPAGRDVLKRIAPILKRAEGQTIRIVGHTDKRPPSVRLQEKYPSNWELSTARAASVINVLQWGFGIEPKRLVAEGVAQYRPLASGSEKDPMATNRAVEIILVPTRE